MLQGDWVAIWWRTYSRDRRNRTTVFGGEPDVITPTGVDNVPSRGIAEGVSEYNAMKICDKVPTHLPSIFRAAVMTSRGLDYTQG